MTRLLAVCALLISIVGCTAIAENRKVEIQGKKKASVTPVSTVIGWRTPYKSDRAKDNWWDVFVPARKVDPVEADLRYFSENTIRWPKKLRPPYKPKPLNLKITKPAKKKAKKAKNKDAALRKRLDEPLVKPKAEVY